MGVPDTKLVVQLRVFGDGCPFDIVREPYESGVQYGAFVRQLRAPSVANQLLYPELLFGGVLVHSTLS